MTRDAGRLVVTDVVRNRGAGAAARSTTTYSLAGRRIGTRLVPELAPGGSSRASVAFAMPAGVLPGPYRVIACADSARRLLEANERNNCRTSARAIRVADTTTPAFAGLESAVTCIPGPSGGPVRSSSYRLTWQPAHDDVTPDRELVYDVYQASTPGGEDVAAPTYTTAPGSVAYTTPALPDDRAYYFVVRARDAAGNRDRNVVERRGTNLCV